MWINQVLLLSQSDYFCSAISQTLLKRTLWPHTQSSGPERGRVRAWLSHVGETSPHLGSRADSRTAGEKWAGQRFDKPPYAFTPQHFKFVKTRLFREELQYHPGHLETNVTFLLLFYKFIHSPLSSQSCVGKIEIPGRDGFGSFFTPAAPIWWA